MLKCLSLFALTAVVGCAGTVVDPQGSPGTGGVGAPGTAGNGSAGTAGTAGTTGTAGAGGTNGIAGRGGTTGAAGTGAVGGAAGTAGMNGTAGSTGTGGGGATCAITAQSSLSTSIPTVGIVTWSSTLANLTSAEIDFGPSAVGPTMVAPVDLNQPSYRTLLLGMKGSSSYVYRIVAQTSSGTCRSQDYTLMTGAVPSGVLKPTVTIGDASAHDKGFLITSGGLNGTVTEILDADGAVVWWATGPAMNSRSHLSWDGTHMYMMSLNVMNTNTGKIVSIAMDGSGSTSLGGVTTSHHDLAAIPGGLATPLWNTSGKDAPCSLVERSDSSGTFTTVVADMGTVYNSTTFHTNAVHYYPSDNSYTVGDRNPNLYVKLTRAGQLVWQFGGSNPKDPSKFFSGVTAWQVNHGHQLLPDGTFLFFNNNANEAWGYKLDTSNMSASKTWSYTASGATSNVLGDVQGLPNGNMLVTFSTTAQIHEVTSSGTLAMKITTPTSSGFGYSEFRESLYGPPPY